MLSTIKLANFRNFEDTSLELSPERTLILGENGRGKTNLLEAVYYLAHAKSFRAEERELIRWNSNNFLIQGGDLAGRNNISAYYDHSGRKIFKTDQKKVPLRDFLGQLTCVTFLPQDVEEIFGAPHARRKYFDELIIKTDKNYYSDVVNYKRVLAHRNHVLFKIREGAGEFSELEIWDVQLSQLGAKIIRKRQDILSYINKKTPKYYHDLSGTDDTLLINYKASYDFDEDISTSLYKSLFINQKTDMEHATTAAGPHRDDFEFIMNGHIITKVASRGEMRTALLALKLAELNVIFEASGAKPILLLDDVFSELDINRRMYLVASITPYQTIITTADEQEEIKKHMTIAHTVELEKVLGHPRA